MAESGAVVGADGRARCPWGVGPADYTEYHDCEWGVPLHGVPELFERITLEAFQSGLSWLTILRKRAAFRLAFAGFAPERVAAFGEADRQRLLADAGIVRNRAKIDAAIRNAGAVLHLDRPLDELLWSFAPERRERRPATVGDIPATTPESTAMAKELKRRGFAFVGPTTCYALMQATGMVDDHLADCWRANWWELLARPAQRCR
ncbi:DNA-3-methyladenine glycosylase I [Saccharopolyspora spinosa]|uniref:DNA-3-methyladenine glycosylase I n=1 Tax=Saccharopolyspora spinosa TaxID=60894 RepID=A0A2N3XUV8_SACSN|nr:DNA-3-methyladenine glycosylase I [Saccharopolyspora spinosa]PKW14457.1 DNA-3-methyladenine glycosylase I [Saccharopolyspora spinosa]